MLNSTLYFIRRSMVNRIKQLRYKPLKVIGKLLVLIYFIYLPILFKSQITDIKFNNPAGFIAIYAVFSIYLSLPSTLTYLKRKGVIFKPENVNFEFTAPFTPKEVLFKGFLLNFSYGIIFELAFFVAGLVIFKIDLWKMIAILILGLSLSMVRDFSICVIMYTSEDISEKQKSIIKYITFAILAAVAVYIIAMVFRSTKVLNMRFLDILNSDVLIFVPVFGFELGLISLIIKGFTIPRLISSILYFLTVLLLFLFAKTTRTTGEYYEDAIKFSEEYSVAIKKAKKTGKAQRVGKKKKVLNKINFDIKGNYASAIFYKQLNEFKKFSLVDKFKMQRIALLASFVIGYFLNKADIPLEGFTTIVGALSIYICLLTYRYFSGEEDYNHYFFYLIPDSMSKKIFYSGLLGNLRTLALGICLFTPALIMLGLGVFNIVGAILTFTSISILFNYIHKGIGKILESRLGNTFGAILTITITLLLGGLAILSGTLVEVASNMHGIGLFIITAMALLISLLFIFINGKLYRNMEFITEE
ncbi:putative ABC exporter domain-containing protein [Lagierella sp.]|uniref:putative ABC exporter domain-containing protein n=1 Tax=Lagierella sp. TaxID=2849657 RepID=UPI002615E318|nr:putative ABC exporter domain-containing protein [Lagierella sp.]